MSGIIGQDLQVKSGLFGFPAGHVLQTKIKSLETTNDGSNYIYEVYNFSYNTIFQRFILFLRIKIVNIIIFFIKYAYYLNKKNNNFKWISIYFKNLIQNILLYNSN